MTNIQKQSSLTEWQLCQISSGWYRLVSPLPMSTHGETLRDIIVSTYDKKTYALYLDALEELRGIQERESVFPRDVPDTFVEAIDQAILLVKQRLEASS